MSESDSERLLIQDYLDVMEKYRCKPAKSPSPDMDMELIQRDYFHLIDNEMEFSEESIAACLREISESLVDESIGQYFLNGLANVLDSERSPWTLTLSRKKWAGKYRLPSESLEDRAIWAFNALKFYQNEGWFTEAAVSEIGETLGISRSTVFKTIKEGEQLVKIIEEFQKEQQFAKKTKSPIPKNCDWTALYLHEF